MDKQIKRTKRRLTQSLRKGNYCNGLLDHRKRQLNRNKQSNNSIKVREKDIHIDKEKGQRERGTHERKKERIRRGCASVPTGLIATSSSELVAHLNAALLSL